MQHGAHTYMFTSESVKGKAKGKGDRKKSAAKAGKANKDDDDDDGPQYDSISHILDAQDAPADDD